MPGAPGAIKSKILPFHVDQTESEHSPALCMGSPRTRVPHLGIFSSLETGGHEPAGCEWHPSGRGRGPGCGVRNPDS